LTAQCNLVVDYVVICKNYERKNGPAEEGEGLRSRRFGTIASCRVNIQIEYIQLDAMVGKDPFEPAGGNTDKSVTHGQ